MDGVPIHHHKRKRFHLHKQQFPATTKHKRFLDKLIYPVAIAGPLLTIPQIVKIFVNQDATGVSLLSWTSYFIIALIWLWYAIAYKEKPLIVTNIAWALAEVFVIAGVIMYG